MNQVHFCLSFADCVRCLSGANANHVKTATTQAALVAAHLQHGVLQQEHLASLLSSATDAAGAERRGAATAAAGTCDGTETAPAR